MLVKLPKGKPATALNVLEGFTDKLLSMTYDKWREMAMHKELSKRTDIAVYFCDPHIPWQRSSNEKMNGLVRQ
jgi:IS30 family transposase